MRYEGKVLGLFRIFKESGYEGLDNVKWSQMPILPLQLNAITNASKLRLM